MPTHLAAFYVLSCTPLGVITANLASHLPVWQCWSTSLQWDVIRPLCDRASGVYGMLLSTLHCRNLSCLGCSLPTSIMEHADKGTLGAVVGKGLFRSNRVWSPRVALRALLRTALEIGCGLMHLHGRSIVHGALRPANVLLKSANLDRRGFTAKVTGKLCNSRGIVQGTVTGNITAWFGDLALRWAGLG